MDTKIQNRPLDDRILTGSAVNVPVEGETGATGGTGNTVAPVLNGPSVTVTAPTDLQSLMEKLRIESRNRREDLIRGQLQTVLAAAVEAIRQNDAAQAKIVEDTKKVSDDVTTHEQKVADINGQLDEKMDPVLLDLRIKELEDAVKREVKTPEEIKKQAEAKRELAELNKEKSEIKDLQGKKDAELHAIKEDKRRIAELQSQLTEASQKVLTDAMREALDGFALPEPETAAERAAKKRGALEDGIQSLARLLGGEKEKDIIEKRIERNV